MGGDQLTHRRATSKKTNIYKGADLYLQTPPELQNTRGETRTPQNENRNINKKLHRKQQGNEPTGATKTPEESKRNHTQKEKGKVKCKNSAQKKQRKKKPQRHRPDKNTRK